MSDMAQAGETRGKILEAFADELCASGYLGVSLDSVASTSGIKKASLYHHFPGGKEEILRAVSSVEFERQSALLARVLEPHRSFEETLIQLALIHADSPPSRSDLDKQIYEATRHVTDETRTQVSSEYLSSLIAPIEELFSRAVESGDVQGDSSFLCWRFLEMAASVVPMPEELGMPPEHRGPTPQAEASARAVVTLFLNGARPR